MAKVLARVVAHNAAPRGPDVIHRIRVAHDWFNDGAVVEFELPRLLSCALCDGGGCDVCERSGAITLRGRSEPPELVQVTLPRRAEAEWQEESERQPKGQRVVLRIPEKGGPADERSELPRGMLLLKIIAADEADPSVTRVRRTEPPPPILEQGRMIPRGARFPLPVVVVAALVALWIAWLAYLRVTGQG